jgi:hypothetical protein
MSGDQDNKKPHQQLTSTNMRWLAVWDATTTTAMWRTHDNDRTGQAWWPSPLTPSPTTRAAGVWVCVSRGTDRWCHVMPCSLHLDKQQVPFSSSCTSSPHQMKPTTTAPQNKRKGHTRSNSTIVANHKDTKK